MSKQIIRTGDVAGFFDRARTAARKADQGGKLAGTVTLSFEDPQRMFTVLSEARRHLISEVLHEPKSISKLSTTLHRNRSSSTKVVSHAGKHGPGHLTKAGQPRPRYPEDRALGRAAH